jgi:hypothetical protein
MSMRKIKNSVTMLSMMFIGLLAVLISNSQVLRADTGCTQKSLTGAYVFAVNGFLTTQTPPQTINAFYPVAASGTLSFDGHGKVSRALTFTFGGQSFPIADSGTYDVKLNCTATANFPATGETFALTIANEKTVTFINTTNGAVGAGTLIKQRAGEEQ